MKHGVQNTCSFLISINLELLLSDVI